MAIGTVVRRELPELADLRVCELSARGPFHAFLARTARELASSEYFEGVAPGERRDGIVCQDVQRLSYPDASFDLCTSTEVFEHVPDDRKGFSEIFRVLVRGGRFVFTVPLSAEPTTRERAVLDRNGLRHLHPPVYHDDWIRGTGRVLVYRDYGRDVVSRLAEAGFADARIEAVPDPADFGALAEVVLARKP
jgi:SAM-dependent methyltransferase